MLIVGELINASRKAISAYIQDENAAAIQQVAKDQFEAGANYIDVNAGIFVGKEVDYIRWLVSRVQEAVDVPCCIDSPSPAAIEAGLSVHKGTPMINSISLEKDRYEKLIPLLAGTDFKVVALCMSDKGMPKSADDRLEVADRLINGLVRNNVKIENIYVDPLVQPVSVNNVFGIEFLDSVRRIMVTFKGVHTICGLSNISYGLSNRKLLNQLFMTIAVANGLDGAIMNPLDRRMIANIIAAEALVGKDNYCVKYIKATRAGKFEALQ